MEMFDYYDNLPEGYIPNNRPRFHKPFRLDIMAGETSTHTFEIPFDVKAKTQDFEVIYQLGLTNIIIKEKEDLTVSDYDRKRHCSTIGCTLSGDETLLFKDTLLDCHVQIKFVMEDGSVSYTELYKVYLSDALTTESEPSPVPTIIKGIGYTED